MKFHYSNYWGAWSRVIGSHKFYTVEIDLTPVNGDRGDWSRIKGVWVRAHCTSRDKKDIDASTLPAEVWSWIGTRVGNDCRHRLVTCDFMSMIDWDRYHSACNGGCALESCLIAPTAAEDAA